MSLQDKRRLVKERFSLLWIVLGCRLRLSSQVERGGFSFAHVSLDSPLALFTGHVAAPVVLAVASLHHFVHVGVVASAAAHQVAAVAPVGGLIALPARKKRRWASTNPCRAFQTTALRWCWSLGWRQHGCISAAACTQQRCRGEHPALYACTGGRENPRAALTSPALMPRIALASPAVTPKITLNSCSDSRFRLGGIQAARQPGPIPVQADEQSYRDTSTKTRTHGP